MRIALACLALLFAAPAAVAQTPAATELPQPAMVYSDQSPAYRFFPGDEVEVTIFSAPELSRSATIGPDGRLALPLIGAVRAADLTAEELRDILVSAYSVHLRMPELTVTPRTYASRRFRRRLVCAPASEMPANIDAFAVARRRLLRARIAATCSYLACKRRNFCD
jgi:polysaccharide export outer membrane protein